MKKSIASGSTTYQVSAAQAGKRARAVKSSVPGLPDGVAGLKFSFC